MGERDSDNLLGRIGSMAMDLSEGVRSTLGSLSSASSTHRAALVGLLGDLEAIKTTWLEIPDDAEESELIDELHELASEADDVRDKYTSEASTIKVEDHQPSKKSSGSGLGETVDRSIEDQDHEPSKTTSGSGKIKILDDQVCVSEPAQSTSTFSVLEDASSCQDVADRVKKIRDRFDNINENRLLTIIGTGHDSGEWGRTSHGYQSDETVNSGFSAGLGSEEDIERKKLSVHSSEPYDEISGDFSRELMFSALESFSPDVSSGLESCIPVKLTANMLPEVSVATVAVNLLLVVLNAKSKLHFEIPYSSYTEYWLEDFKHDVLAKESGESSCPPFWHVFRVDEILRKLHNLEVESFVKEDLCAQVLRFMELLHFTVKSYNQSRIQKNYADRNFEFLLSSLRQKPSSEIDLLRKIKSINREMECTLSVGAAFADLKTSLSMQRKLSLFQDKSEMDQLIGREEQLAGLLRQLLDEEERFPHLHVIPIFGMAGVGKTILARKVYHVVQDVGGFYTYIWINLPSKLHDRDKCILELVAMQLWGVEKCSQIEGVEGLARELKKFLATIKFLIVLDDMEKLELLEDALGLPDSRNGSRILITTRTSVTTQFKHFLPAIEESINHIKPLAEEEGLQIFQNNEQHHEYVGFFPFGFIKDLRVPAIAKLVSGGSLITLDQPLDELVEDPYRYVIDLSLRSLPYELKLFFAYLTMYCGNCEYDVEKLIRSWTAHGLIIATPRDEQLTAEVVVETYLDELVCRGLVKIMKSDSFGKPLTWMIHKDFLHSDALSEIKHDLIEKFVVGREFFHFETPCADFMDFVLLRVLDLESGAKKELPGIIGDLSQLKYLGLRYNPLEILPDSIGNLTLLQTLDIRDTNIICLPQAVWNICSLRHICGLIDGVPDSIARLTHLQTLDTMIGGSWINNSMSKLTALRRLSLYRSESIQVTPYICNELPSFLDEVHLCWVPLNVTFLQSLKDLKFLRILSLTMMDDQEIICPTGSFPELEVMWLKSMRHLKTWVVEKESMPKLSHLTLENCKLLTMLPHMLQRPSIIKNLKLVSMPSTFKKRLCV